MAKNFFTDRVLLHGRPVHACGERRRLGARATSFSQNIGDTSEPRDNSLESRALMLRGTRHEEGRGFGAKAVSFFELKTGRSGDVTMGR